MNDDTDAVWITFWALLCGRPSLPSWFLADCTIGRAFGTLCLSVCLSSVCDVLYRGETVSRSENYLKKWIWNQGRKLIFWVAAIFLLPVSPLRPLRRPFLPYFCPYSPAIGTRWHKQTDRRTTQCAKQWRIQRGGQGGMPPPKTSGNFLMCRLSH